jgi:hypothetical protein
VNPCQDSAARVPKASRSDASVASALAADLAGLHDTGAGGMARRRDPRASADVAASCPSGGPAGVSARRRRRGPPGPKEGSRRPARHGFPLEADQLRADAAPRSNQPLTRASLSRCGGQPPLGALRAPLKM